MAVALVAGTLALSSCDSGDTIVSVNYSFDDATAMDVHMNVAKLHITVKAAAGNPVETDLDLMRDPDAGTITTATYKRITVNGLSGTATVTVVAKDSSGTEFKDSDGMTLMAVTPADSVVVEEHKVTAAFVTFKRVVKMPGGAGGAGGAGTGGTNGSGGTDASGGTTGSGGSGSGGSGSGGA